MRHYRLAFAAGSMILIAGTVVACTQNDAGFLADSLLEEERATATRAPTVAVAEEASATPADLTPIPTEIDQACVDCHTDQERLEAMAFEPEVEEGPSSGEG